MAKNSIRDFSATAGSNTDIQSVNIDENCPASGINNAIRELMVDLKNVSTGAVNLETPAVDQLNFGDNAKCQFGNSQDLQLYHDASDSYVKDSGTGDLKILGNNIKLRNAGDTIDYIATNASSGAVTLSHDGNSKFATTSTGVNVTGNGIFQSTTSTQLNIRHTASGNGYGYIFRTTGSTTNDLIVESEVNGTATERMRISGGNLLVGTTDAAPRNLSSGSGIRLGNDGSVEAAKATSPPGRFNRTGDDGEVIQIRRDGTSRGRLGIKNTYPYIGEGGTGLLFEYGSSVIEPFNVGAISARDDAIDLGGTSARFDDIRATNGTIQTSDKNDKQQIASLTSTEIAAAKAISALFKTYKWNKSVTANGDAARTHTGVIAQEVQAAMSAVGLDATKYAFWCSDTWLEHSVDVAAVEADEEAGIEARDAYTRIDTYKTSEEAPTGATERTRLGIRYPELLAFVGAATEQRLADIETRLTALEA